MLLVDWLAMHTCCKKWLERSKFIELLLGTEVAMPHCVTGGGVSNPHDCQILLQQPPSKYLSH